MKKVLFGGAFDLIHYGHLLAISEAKKQGDYLIVNVMSDERCRLKKGDKRPIVPAVERVEMVKALREVDEVNCLFGVAEYPTLGLLDILRPDVLVIDGSDQKHEQELKDRCDELGIRFHHLDRIITPSGLDTTGIIKKIKDTHNSSR